MMTHTTITLVESDGLSQWRPHDFYIVFLSNGHSPFNESGSVYFFVANNLNKELLESWRREDNQHLGRGWSSVPESMDGTSRDQDKGSNSPSDCLFSDLDVELSLKNIECLFLGFVEMLWWPVTRYDHLKQRVGSSSSPSEDYLTVLAGQRQ